jgi:hypothetical protein
MRGQIRTLGKVLSEQAVNVLISAALPWTLWIAKVHAKSGVSAETRMLAHLGALVPRQRPPKLLGKRDHCARNRIAYCRGTMALGLGKSAIGTLVERATRYTVLVQPPHM